MNNSWISIKDRLPENGERCLFVASEWDVPPYIFFGYRFHNYWYLDGAFYAKDGPDWHAPSDVFCWLPIPKIEGIKLHKEAKWLTNQSPPQS